MKNIITAIEAKAISEKNKSVGFKSIMDTVEEYATQGKTEFEIRMSEKEAVKRWEYELTQLGYTIKIPEKGAWVLSWSDADKLTRSKHLSIQELVDLAIEKNIIIVDGKIYAAVHI